MFTMICSTSIGCTSGTSLIPSTPSIVYVVMEFAFMVAVKYMFCVSTAILSESVTSAQCSPSASVPLVRMAVIVLPIVLNLDKSNFHVLSESDVLDATTTTFLLVLS